MQQYRYALALVLLLAMGPVAWAAPDAQAEPQADPAVAALTNTQGRYTIGPWEGAGAGDSCVLTNYEPLNFAVLDLRLNNGRLLATVTPTLGGAALTAELSATQIAQPFFSVGAYRFDSHGLDRALPLLQKCRENALPDELPHEAVEEGDAQPVVGAWQMIPLTMGGYVYARYALMGEGEVSLWRHNDGDLVLSLAYSSLLEDGARIGLNGQVRQAIPQEGVFFVPLTDDLKAQLMAQPRLELSGAGQKRTIDLGDFAKVLAALNGK